MQSKEVSTYTKNCMVLGLVAGFAFYFLMNDRADAVVQYIFGTSSYFQHPNMTVITLWHGLVAVVALSVCWLSSRLDFINPSDDKTGKLIGRSIKIMIALIVMVIIFSLVEIIEKDFGWGAARRSAANPQPRAEYTRAPFEPSTIFYTTAILIAFLLFTIVHAIVGIGSGIFLFVISPLTLGLGFAALLCLPRASIYSNTAHKLRRAVKEAKGSGMISADQVVAGVGERSTSAAHATGLRKDLNAQLEEARQVAARLKAEEERLSKAMHHDTKRLKEEAELLKVLEEIDRYKLKIKTLEAAQRKQAR